MKVAAFVPNLMDRSRFGNAEVAFVRSATEVSESGAKLVLVDLDRCQNAADFRLDDTVVIGFGSHVDAESQASAQEVGFDEVLARSVFFRRLPEILGTR